MRLISHPFFTFLVSCFCLAACTGSTDRHSVLDLQNTINHYGCPTPCVNINPTLLTPFLDENEREEAILKKFLGDVTQMQLFALDNQDMYDELVQKVSKVGYSLLVQKHYDNQRLKVFADVDNQKKINSLIIFAQQDDAYYYCIDMTGSVYFSQVESLSQIRPVFFEQYFKRFRFNF